MPVYEYRCKNNHITEELRPLSKRNEPSVCSDCGEPAKRILSSPTVIMGETYPGQKLMDLNPETLKYEKKFQ